ncbi:hypothetical protein R1flu_019858 [Riccia fluitans]|uniref:Uncharacterized protein n=1 Tax=Riccia fluitans TaxID=41844 RepID=A0ABD1ZK68_9MARC
MEGEEGVTEAEGGVPEPEAGNMEGEEGVTEAKGGVAEVEAGNMEVEGGVTEAEDWDFRNLVVLPIGRQVEHESHVIDDFHAGGDHKTLSDTLVVGDVFAVKADDEEMEYWLLRCTSRKHKITKKEKKLKGLKFIYVEVKKKGPIVIYSHLVRAVKIRMASMPPMGKQQDTARFSIDNETHEQILAALSESEAPPFEKV